ncbi:hypothetical protein CSA_017719, partial [Cucumis sativus]
MEWREEEEASPLPPLLKRRKVHDDASNSYKKEKRRKLDVAIDPKPLTIRPLTLSSPPPKSKSSIPVLIQKLKLPVINLTQVFSHVYYPLTTKSPIIITTSFTSRPDRTSPYPIKRALLAKKNSLGLRRKTCITFSLPRTTI